MSPEDVRANLEEDLSWRWDEIRHIKNAFTDYLGGMDKDFPVKTLIVILYAHFEGFTKNALSFYSDFINNKGLKCREVNNNLSALALKPVFESYENPEKNLPFLKKIYPMTTTYIGILGKLIC